MLSAARIFAFCSLSIFVCTSQYPPTQNNLIESLDQLLDFLILDADNIDTDCLLGVVVAEAQLNLILEKPFEIKNRKLVQTLRDKCRYICNTVKPNIPIPNAQYEIFVATLLNAEMWQINNTFKYGLLKESPPLKIKFLGDFLFSGVPNETISDICLNDLIKKAKEKCCIPTDMCQEIMFDFDQSHGYPLTHKLLYLQIGRALECFKQSHSLKSSILYLCSRILRDFRSIENLSTTLQQDLYVEQMVLCGMEGFEEFLQPKARRYLLDWQTEHGCYGNTTFIKTNNISRPKRMTNTMLHNCSSHFSGLAAAGLALNIRYLNSNTFVSLGHFYS